MALHGVRWKDDLEWMEEMKGERWKKFVEQQQKRFSQQIDSVDEPIDLLAKELEAASLTSKAQLFTAANKQIQIGYRSRFSLQWNWVGGEKRIAVDLDVCSKYPGYVWVIEEAEESKGAEVYQVCCYKGETCIWKHKGVGPYCTVIEGRCYALEAENKLWYCRLISWDALTGKDKKVHYEETNRRYNLELLKGSCERGVLRRQAGPLQDCFWIQKKGLLTVEGILLESRRFVFDARKPENYYVWTAATGWKGRGKVRELGAKEVPEFLCLDSDLLITRWKGQRTIWRSGKAVWHDVANILVDPWEGSMVRLTIPGHEVLWWDSKDICPGKAIATAGKVSLRQTLRGVPYVLILPQGLAKHILVAGYGAYGLPSMLGTHRWQPLLHRDWAIAFPLFRGGGDHTPEWEDEGRLSGREKVLKDAEELIREVHIVTGLGPKHTWIYGRSAGGLWVGGTVARHAYGDLIAGAYMEVPYLDVLSTTTNRTLPLTNMEADEFGLPEMRLSDFMGIVRWSPMEQLVSLPKPPRIWQLVRTGLNDSQVYAYEAAKWVSRSGVKAFLAVQGDQGHFLSGALGLRQEAEDLVLLLTLSKKIKNRSRVYKMANRKQNVTRKNRKTNMRKNRKASTRRNRKASSRKNRK